MKIKLLIIPLILTLILLSFAVTSLFFQTGTNERPVTLEIPKGASVNLIARLLYSNGIIRRELDFKIVSRLLGLQEKLQAGSYKFRPYPFLYEVLFKIKKGEIVGDEPLKVTFPEGASIYKMGSFLEKEGVGCFEDFRGLTNNDLAKEFKLPTRSLEGYLFPDTYIFNKNISAEALAHLMHKRFNEVVIPYWEQNKKSTKYDLHQILTLASIIEKEAALPSERPIISSVFHNRLDINMALDACPTIKYALERPSKIVYFNQLKVRSPYNTYLNRGLPPGPICNPGFSSIKAAIYPANTNYLYFIAKKDGSHIFSATWADHQKARVIPTQ